MKFSFVILWLPFFLVSCLFKKDNESGELKHNYIPPYELGDTVNFVSLNDTIAYKVSYIVNLVGPFHYNVKTYFGKHYFFLLSDMRGDSFYPSITVSVNNFEIVVDLDDCESRLNIGQDVGRKYRSVVNGFVFYDILSLVPVCRDTVAFTNVQYDLYNGVVEYTDSKNVKWQISGHR